MSAGYCKCTHSLNRHGAGSGKCATCACTDPRPTNKRATRSPEAKARRLANAIERGYVEPLPGGTFARSLANPIPGMTQAQRDAILRRVQTKPERSR